MLKVFVAPFPFAQIDQEPRRRLEALSGISLQWNPFPRKMTTAELIEVVPTCDIVIAGTETYNAQVLHSADQLKLIARVGIGLDNLDRAEIHRRGILLTYTPDAPAPAVAELTVGHMLNLARGVHQSHAGLRRGEWQRIVGRRLEHMRIGIVGSGRVGSRVLRMLQGFNVKELFVHDINPDFETYRKVGATHLSWEEILRKSDLLSLHVPLTAKTRGMLGAAQIAQLPKNALLVNTARGELIDEAALLQSLNSGHLGAAACDVFSEEPYQGPLREVKNCLLTAHLGSCSVDCRLAMELGAVEEVERFVRGLAPKIPVDSKQEY